MCKTGFARRALTGNGMRCARRGRGRFVQTTENPAGSPGSRSRRSTALPRVRAIHIVANPRQTNRAESISSSIRPGAASTVRFARTLRWRELDSNFRFLVARPSNRHGRSDCFLETWSGSVGEPEIRIHLPPARSPLRTGSNKSGAGAADPWGAHPALHLPPAESRVRTRFGLSCDYS